MKPGRKNFSVAAAVYPLLILAAGCLAYYNSFQGVFVFDDGILIEECLELRTLWPPWDAMFGGIHYTRPVAGLTFAINYAIDGLNIWSYHLFNLVIHLVAALALFGTLLVTMSQTRFRELSALFALVITLIWTVHPLQTESVTYIAQRYESLMGMCFLLTLFFYSLSVWNSHHRSLWQVLAILFCFLGVGSKQVAALLPIVVVLYDRTFVTGSLRVSIKQSWRFFLLLFSSWIPLLILGLTAEPFDWAGFDMEVVTPWKFAISEFGVIVHYLRLSFWPDALVFDYFWQIADRPGEIIPQALSIFTLAAFSIFGLIRNHPFGFLGCSFFLVLAPTSSVMPLSDLAADHRMYLPLISVITISVLSLFVLCQRLPQSLKSPPLVSGKAPDISFSSKPGIVFFLVLMLISVVSLTSLTIRRNELFHSREGIWRDTTVKAPHNPRAWANLGVALVGEKRFDEAMAAFKKALVLKPDYSIVLMNLGYIYNLQQQPVKAIYFWERSLVSRPHYRTYYNLGLIYQLRGDKRKAVHYFKKAVIEKPRWKPALVRLSWLLATDPVATPQQRKKALEMAQKAISRPEMINIYYLDTLAAAYAANLKFKRALQIQLQAIKKAGKEAQPGILKLMHRRAWLYLNNQAFTIPQNRIDLTVSLPR